MLLVLLALVLAGGKNEEVGVVGDANGGEADVRHFVCSGLICKEV